MQLGALYLEPGDLFVSLLAIGCFIAIYFIFKATKASYEDGYNEERRLRKGLPRRSARRSSHRR